MKVLQVITNLALGGSEKLLEELVPLLNQVEDLRVDILLLTDKNNVFYESLLNKGVNIEIVSLKNPLNPLNVYEIVKHIKSEDYDIVHSHTFLAQYWVGIAKIFIGNKTKFFTTEHSTHNRRRNKFYFKFIEKLIYSCYDTVVCVTEQVRFNLIKWINPTESELSKYIIIKNGVNINKYRDAKPYKKKEINCCFNDDIKLVTMVSRFSKAKDHKTLIHAISFLPKNVHLLLVGEGSLRSSFENYSRELNISKRVHFLGFRDDVNRLLKTSDVIVLSSHWEGLSIAAIEAMASGKPFVASRVQGLEEMVEGYGLLFEEENSEELADIINKLLNDFELYKEISEKCLQRANDFSIQTMAELLVKVYKS